MMTWLMPVAVALSLALGGWLLVAPRRAIEFQIAFYRRINWKMEPISWRREIISTRVMGLLVIVVVVGVLAVRLKG